jgi:hypothetical protein
MTEIESINSKQIKQMSLKEFRTTYAPFPDRKMKEARELYKEYIFYGILPEPKEIEIEDLDKTINEIVRLNKGPSIRTLFNNKVSYDDTIEITSNAKTIRNIATEMDIFLTGNAQYGKASVCDIILNATKEELQNIPHTWTITIKFKRYSLENGKDFLEGLLDIIKEVIPEFNGTLKLNEHGNILELKC